MTTCALCKQERPLRQSHVIPEFMFGPLYDERHRFLAVSSIPANPNKLVQKGPRERLLCSDCEQRLARYERYASGVFFGDATTQPQRTRTGFLFTGLQYKPLKLFFLSLIWRLDRTSIPRLKGAQLGPYSDRLRLLLVADNPSDYLTFPVFVTSLTDKGDHMPGLIIPPLHTRIEGRRVWAVVIAGYLFHFFVSNRPPPQNMCGGCLQEDGSFPLHLSEISNVRFLQEWFAKIAAAERIREAAAQRS